MGKVYKVYSKNKGTTGVALFPKTKMGHLDALKRAFDEGVPVWCGEAVSENGNLAPCDEGIDPRKGAKGDEFVSDPLADSTPELAPEPVLAEGVDLGRLFDRMRAPRDWNGKEWADEVYGPKTALYYQKSGKKP